MKTDSLKIKKGFALIEMLIAVAILSIVLLSVFSGVSTGINVMSGNRNLTRAMVIAKSRMNEFILDKMRGPDINTKSIEEYPGFYYSRETRRFEHALLPPLLSMQKTDLTVSWKEKNRTKKYSIFYVYTTN